MSAADTADGHDEGELHQAPWVYFTTYTVCLSFLALFMFAKGLVFAGTAIIWFSLVSIPIQIHLAKRQWVTLGLWLLAAPIGYFLLPYFLDLLSWLLGWVGAAISGLGSLIFG